MTIPDVAQAIGLSTRAVEKQIARLRKGGRLRRLWGLDVRKLGRGGLRSLSLRERLGEGVR